MTMTRGWFVTGTDTGVGKTQVSLALLRKLQQRGVVAAGMKPVAAGCARTASGLRNDDALRLQQQSSIELDYTLVNPYALEPAIAPHLAAEQAGVRLEMAVILDAYARIAARVEAVVVEGAGGWLVPMNEQETLAGLAAALQLDIILVVGIRLGCLNHALLTVESIQRRGVSLAGWVANCPGPADATTAANIASLEARIASPLLGELPWQDKPDVNNMADRLLLPTEPGT
jgi:dethiobiotin synthetase